MVQNNNINRSMIYAYCLSVFSLHFFTKHNISKFKLRLINQQTGDCTDSIILDAQKLTTDTFPVPIKLKGGQRLLMKIKLLSIPSKSNEVLVGEGVVNFDKSSIDSTLRVPIYDKQRGVEEIAICSIDFFLSGFQVEKHVSINVDKSRSRFEDWRERTEDAVYSQMSYTVESQEERKVEVDPKTTGNLKKNEAVKNMANQAANKLKRESKDDKLKSNINSSRKPNSSKNMEKQSVKKEQDRDQQDNENLNKPFALQNSVYLGQTIPKKKNNPQQHVNKDNKQFVFDTLSQQIFKDIQDHKAEHSPKKNDLMISKLKKYIETIENNKNDHDSSPKNKKRRKNIKVQQYGAYNFQNIFVKYHQDPKWKPTKILRNIRAVRLIKNEIKQDQEGRVIPQNINKLFITLPNNQKLVSFDAIGFKSHCIINSQSQSTVCIQVPGDQAILKVIVVLNEEGNFQGTFGLQEGENMSIKLSRMENSGNQPILSRSEFKLIFDLKSELQRRSAKLININNDGSFRQPYDILVPQQDIKKRVQLLSGQPWGFVQSYAKQANLTLQSKQLINKINKEMPQNELSKVWATKNNNQQKQKTNKNSQKKVSSSSELKSHQPSPNLANQQKVRASSSKTKEYLQNTPIKIKKLKPIASSNEHNPDISQINSIRNGNRNNYRFQERAPSKQIKQAWEEILFKRKIQEENQKQRQKLSKMNQIKFQNKKKVKLLDSLNSQSLNSQSDSLSSNKQPKKISKANKLYQYSESDQKTSKFPMRSLRLKILSISITQPQAVIEEKRQDEIGKFVKFSIKHSVIYFTEVIFNGEYNSILWKLQGCIFERLLGNQKLEVQIYQTLNNRIKMIGKSQIRVNRLFFLRNNHVYNGRIACNNILNGQFTMSFEIQEYFPFEVIEEEDEETVNLKKNHSQSKNRYRTKNINTMTHHSQKYIHAPSTLKGSKKPNIYKEQREYDVDLREQQLQQSMSMPIGLTKSQS